jgi:hypothetical protein
VATHYKSPAPNPHSELSDPQYALHIHSNPKRKFLEYHSNPIFFFRNTAQTQTFTYMRIHSPLLTHTRAPYPYEHLRNTEPANWILKLTKSWQTPRYRWERRLPRNEYSAFIRHTTFKLGIWTLVGWVVLHSNLPSMMFYRTTLHDSYHFFFWKKHVLAIWRNNLIMMMTCTKSIAVPPTVGTRCPTHGYIWISI